VRVLGGTQFSCPESITGYTMDNGLTVVAEPIPHVRSVAVGFWILAGSRDEQPHEQGISHLLEHLLFKGTEKRSARQIAETMDQVGGQLNAFTTKEYTCYYARILDEHLPVALDVLGDMIRNPMCREEDIEREKGVILEEIGMYEDAPDELVHDLFVQAVWKNHPLGRSVLGTEETVSALSHRDILRHMAARYAPDNSVMAVAGSFDPAQLTDLLAGAFGSWSARAARGPEGAPVADVATDLRSKDTELVHLCLGGVGLPLEAPGSYALNLLANVLGGGPSSRLFQEVREERGLAYSVFSYASAFRDSGLFVLYCGAGRERIGTAAGVIGAELRRIGREGVSQAELGRAKEQMKSNLTMALESTGARMNRLGRSQLLLGRVVPIDELLHRIQAVTVEEVLGLAARFSDPDKLSLVAIGPQLDELDLRSTFHG
jgi:predicted Zn-dependent peptidase